MNRENQNLETEPQICAIIPVRGGSKRLKNKNILPFGDSNLLIHKIRQLKQVQGLTRIVVSSENEEMLAMAKAEGVSIHRRPMEYCDEQTKSFNDVVEYIMQDMDEDNILWAPCVSPLVTIATYENAITKFKELVISKKSYDSVISCKLFKEYLFDENKALNWNPKKHIPSQELPDWKVITNGFYLAKKDDMLAWRFVYGENPYIYILNKKEAVDIDDADDFEIAKALLGNGAR